MSEPTIAAKQPVVLDLDAGTHHWCQCGDSKTQPFCDGSHQGTEFQPVPFELSEKKKVALCLCKRTQKAPHCDGSHKAI